MKEQDLVTAILDGTIDEATVVSAIKEAHRRRNANNLLKAQLSLKLKSRVKLHGLTPKRLNGLTGTISRFNQTHSRADVTADQDWGFDYPKGRIVYGVPLGCLEAV
jgi:hypothetical protein